MSRVLLLSSDILPLPGLPTTGAGLRAWGLGQGLQSRGHQVHYSMPARALRPEWREHLPAEIVALAWEPGSIRPILDRAQPDVLVVCNWPVLAMMPDELDLPVALDQHGPHLLERFFQGYRSVTLNMEDKLRGLARADFFTCAGQKQRLYFLPWLLQAGFSLADERWAAIPVSLSPDLPQRGPTDELTFVYGGVFLPWQDPRLALTVLVETLEQRGRGRLLFFGGQHPIYTVDTGVFESLRQYLEGSPRVVVQPMQPHDRLIETYTRASAAIDLMARNAERELAFTTRTVEYLWCGLPVIYNDYAELAGWIRDYDAGWALDPADRAAIGATVAAIVDEPQILAERSRHAQQLVREQLTWDRTIDPLDQFVRAPSKRSRAGQVLLAPGRDANRSKTPGQLVDEALFHYRSGGLPALVKESIGYYRRRRRHRDNQ